LGYLGGGGSESFGFRDGTPQLKDARFERAADAHDGPRVPKRIGAVKVVFDGGEVCPQRNDIEADGRPHWFLSSDACAR
jgi:hypothetical protein